MSSNIPLAHPSGGINAEELLPGRIRTGPDGLTHIENVAISELVERFATPLWVISRNQLLDNYEELRAVAQPLEPFEIAYSMKANNNRSVLDTLASAGALVDCSSEWELQLALNAGVAGNRIILNGNGKAKSYLSLAVRAGVRQVNVDSLAEVHRLDDLSRQMGTHVDCVVRVKLTYAQLLEHDPSYERTLRVAEGKFGSSVANGEAVALVDAINASPLLHFKGLSHHAGFAGYRANYTPENQLLHLRECAREMSAFATLLADRGDVCERLNVGGGLRSGRYVVISTPGDGTDVALHPLPSPTEYIGAIADGIDAGWGGSSRPTVQLETGGYHIANATVLLTSVQDVKESEFPSRRRFVTVDSSMTMFTTRGSSRVGYPVLLAGNPPATPASSHPVEVVGPTCAYDSIAEDISLPEVEPGDVLVLLNQGAYAEVASTQFNGLPRPAVALVDDARATLVRRRETLADIVAREIEVEREPVGPRGEGSDD